MSGNGQVFTQTNTSGNVITFQGVATGVQYTLTIDAFSGVGTINSVQTFIAASSVVDYFITYQKTQNNLCCNEYPIHKNFNLLKFYRNDTLSSPPVGENTFVDYSIYLQPSGWIDGSTDALASDWFLLSDTTIPPTDPDPDSHRIVIYEKIGVACDNLLIGQPKNYPTIDQGYYVATSTNGGALSKPIPPPSSLGMTAHDDAFITRRPIGFVYSPKNVVTTDHLATYLGFSPLASSVLMSFTSQLIEGSSIGPEGYYFYSDNLPISPGFYFDFYSLTYA